MLQVAQVAISGGQPGGDLSVEIGTVNDRSGNVQSDPGLVAGGEGQMRSLLRGYPPGPDRPVTPRSVRPPGQVNSVVHDGHRAEQVLPAAGRVLADRHELHGRA